MEAAVNVLSFEKELLVGADFSFHYNEDAHQNQQLLNMFQCETGEKIKKEWKLGTQELAEKQNN